MRRGFSKNLISAPQELQKNGGDHDRTLHGKDDGNDDGKNSGKNSDKSCSFKSKKSYIGKALVNPPPKRFLNHHQEISQKQTARHKGGPFCINQASISLKIFIYTPLIK